jgi:hypothetical protein
MGNHSGVADALAAVTMWLCGQTTYGIRSGAGIAEEGIEMMEPDYFEIHIRKNGVWLDPILYYGSAQNLCKTVERIGGAHFGHINNVQVHSIDWRGSHFDLAMVQQSDCIVTMEKPRGGQQ